MLKDISFLNDDELQEFRNWIQGKRDHYDRLLKKIDSKIGGSKRINHQTTKSPSGKSKTSGKIVKVMGKSGKWLSNLEIRELLKKEVDLTISSNGLRAQLIKGEGTVFKRKGDSKFTKWKLIENGGK